MYVCMYQGLGLFTGKLPEALEPLAEFLDSKEAVATGLERALKKKTVFFYSKGLENSSVSRFEI